MMSIWMEIRCETRKPKAGTRCYSTMNAGPMCLIQDTRKGVTQGLSHLNDQAKRAGWVKCKDGWVCPACKNEPGTKINDLTPKG